MESSRDFDVVVWGATGFTGKWVAKHLFDHYPQSELRWAIAGRNPEKLNQTREFIGDKDAVTQDILADSNDEVSLKKMVQRTKVIISTVGPYAYYGSKLVKACAELGTHYVDLTGEVPWMREMIDAYQSDAQASGAKIVHSCGFDSIPSDMGNFFTQQKAFEKYGSYLKNVRFSLIKAKGGVSGGTVHSLLNVVEEAVNNKKVRKLLSNPYSLNPDQSFKGPDELEQRTAKYDDDIGMWTAPFIMASINTRIVRRSNALLDFRYGKDNTYSETMATAPGFKGRFAATSIASSFALFGLVAITSLGRKLFGFILPSQGEGPKVDPQDPGFYTIDFYGETAAGEQFSTRLTGDADPGYGSTSKMLAESAVCLALEESSSVKGGFWTASSAMGDNLMERLEDKAGLEFNVLDS